MTHTMIRIALIFIVAPLVLVGCTKSEDQTKKMTFDPLAADSTLNPEATPVEEITTTKTKSKSKKTSSGMTIYFVQFGMFVERANAEKLVEQLQAKKYPAVLESVPHKKHGTLHRVRLRPFANKQSAEDAAAEIKAKEGLDAFVTSTDQ